MTNPIVYLGPPGAGLGFQLSGIDVVSVDSSDQLVDLLKQYKQDDTYSLIFVDEVLAGNILEEVESLNQDPLPTIVLLPNSAQPQYLSQQKMNRLMVKAVGSDIFSK